MTTGDNPRKSFSIVGIGASAGGLNPLQRFLAELPVDFGFALVFIQHLSTKHKSLLQELLTGRRPSLMIQQISDGLKIQPGILYLAPPGREVRLRNSLFQTTVHPEGLIHLPIDEFFSSLAEDAGERSIAVIFSGAGTDGARGCQAIRSVGGTVYIQDPNTAEFDSMPLAAIATGQADAVLSPGDIAAELLKLQGTGQAVVSRELPITPEEFDGFFRLIREKTGSRFDHYKKSVVSRRIRRRMCLHGLSVVKDYLDMLAASDPEAAHLASDLMIGVTSFFRDRVAWKALNLEAIRKIVAENTNLPVRVWTPASATGEEAYSIAMMLLHEIALAGKKRDIQVFATDVNERALERAREGKYPASITADVSQEYIQKYFTSTDDDNFLVVNKDVRESVVFARQDLLTDPPFSKLDLIICRNFLIYLEPEAQEKSITLFHYALKEGGYLFLGNAETVGRKSAAFRSIGHKQCRVYRKLETKPSSRLPISVPYALERQAPPARQAHMTEQGRSVMEIIQEKLLEEYGPASVAIDQNYEIIYHNGPTNRYLHQPRGVPTQNLLELVPENLRSRIRGALYRSGREERPVLIRTSVAGDDNKTRHVTLRITKAAENLHIVVFQEKPLLSKKEAAEQVDATVIEETAIHQLEGELSATKADLQSHIEQLKSLNEELQSSNEELQAANEELETSREELQSLNEELVTVNSQLQGKIEEQDATNDDLNNFQASTNIPMIFLDTHFRVKRFTPAMIGLIKLLPSDVGRPIVDMSQENLGPNLTSDARAVLESLMPARQEMQMNGEWYVRTTLPYRTADNRIEGVVITYNDVSELKKSEERTKHLASFPELNPNPVCEVHSSGKVNFCNPATVKVLANLGMDTEDLTVFVPEDMDGILRALGNKEEQSLYREKVIKDRIFGMTVHLVPQFNVVRIYADDITERKKAEESQGRLAAIVASAEDAIISKDLNGVIQTWNVGAETIFGYTAEEAIGRNISLLVPPGHADQVPDILKRLSQGEHIENFETVRMRKDGAIIPVSLNFSAIRDPNGRVIGASKIAHDITERKQTEEALRASEEQFRTLADSIPNLAWWANADGYITWYNRRWYEYTGTTPEQMEGWGWQSVHDPQVLPKVMERWQASIATGEPFDMEFPLRGVDGIFRTFLTRVLPLKDSAGRVLRWFGTNTDISAHKQAEEALRESEGKYRSLFDNMIDGFAYHRLVLDETGKPVDYIFLEVNDSFERLTGLKRADIAGKRVREVLPGIENDPADWIGAYGRVALTGREARFEQYAAALGKWYSVTAYCPQKEHFATIFEDVTERKQAEETLHQLNRTLQALSHSDRALLRATEEAAYLQEICRIIVENCGYAMVWVGFTEHDEAKSVRPAAAAGFDAGYLDTLQLTWADTERGRGPTGTAIRTGSVAMCRNMQTDPQFEPWRAEAIKRGYASSAVFPLLADGRAFGALTIYSREPEGFSDDEVKLLTELAGDFAYGITTLRLRAKHAAIEAALRESEERYRSLFENMLHGFAYCKMLYDDDGRPLDFIYLDVNSAFGKLTGLENVAGKRVTEVIPGIREAHPELFDIYGRVASTRQPEKFEIEFNPLGLWLSISVYSNVREHFVAIFDDITERKKAEADILKLSEDMVARNLELESVNKELESFIYSVSHDLRAPIRTMSGFAKIINEDYAGKLDAQGRDYLERILKGSEKSTQLINDLMRLSTISRQELGKIDVDLSKKVSKAVEELRQTNQGRSVEVVVQDGLTAAADPTLIELALSNLLGNAWKFTSETGKPRIEFGSVVKNGKMVYFVKDNGAGFDMTYADKMFLPFHRLHSEKEFEGTGIGLAIVERIIRRHGGKVWAEGEVGKGATFFFTLG